MLTISCTGSDLAHTPADDLHLISTHAPRVGSDYGHQPYHLVYHYFNPRSPCGERPLFPLLTSLVIIFQPTLPVRGATPHAQPNKGDSNISTHAPRAGSDRINYITIGGSNISTHAPRAGSDSGGRMCCPSARISTHAPRAGSDLYF